MNYSLYVGMRVRLYPLFSVRGKNNVKIAVSVKTVMSRCIS